jgi:hypothetical protein
MKILKALTVLLCAIVFTAKAQLSEVSGFENPESVAAYKQYLFVSNMGPKMEPMAKDGDGYISQLSRKDGKVTELKYYTGLNSPKGIYIHCHTMYVADVDKVVAIDLKTKKKLWEADFSSLGVKYLNDITRACCGSIFVSATDKNAVYKVCKKGTIKQLTVKGNIEGANGLYRGCGKLYIANYGRGGQTDGSYGVICLLTKKYKALQNGGIYDGIQRSCGKLIISDWVSNNLADDKSHGRIVVYKPCHKKMVEINVGRYINGPSDIYIDHCTKLLWIPAMREGKIISVPMKEIKMLSCTKKK